MIKTSEIARIVSLFVRYIYFKSKACGFAKCFYIRESSNPRLSSRYSLDAFRTARPWIVNSPAVVELSTNRNISEIGHRIVESPVQIDRVDHQAGTIGSELTDDLSVRLNET